MSSDNHVHDVREGSGVLIDARLRPGRGEHGELRSPIDGSVTGVVRFGDAVDAEAAVSAAAVAQPRWAARPTDERVRALTAIADALDASATGALATLVTEETGKRRAEAVAELAMSATYCRAFADVLTGMDEQVLSVVPGIEHVVATRPLGVVAVLTPWNFPVSIPVRKIAAALAAGCGVVFKPSEVAPLSGLALAALLDEHLPAGLVNTVLGTPEHVVTTWLRHDAVRALSFTGSTRVGRLLAVEAAPRFLRTVMELGGCAPFIVLPDADPVDAAAVLVTAKFRNNGQSCIAANQVFVAREVAEPFVEEFCRRVLGLEVGDPRESGTDVGPLAPRADPARIGALVADAVADGAVLRRSDAPLPPDGHYVEPTVLLDAPLTCAAMTSEIFGPVAPVHVYDDLEPVLRAHRATGSGLAGYVCGEDTERAMSVASRLQAGVLGINTATPNTPHAPFGGLDQSGLGYEGGRLGVEQFLSFHNIAVGLSAVRA